jgi:glycosyltransferase involved in cell wall biosynthesis
MLSIHQSAFIRQLAEDFEVTLIVEREIEELRLKDGWNKPNFGKARIIIAVKRNVIEQNLCPDSIHLFSGISAYKMVNTAFGFAIKRNFKVGIISEPFDWIGLKGKLRFLKYYWLRFKYENYIDFILTIGERGHWCYRKVGFPKNKLFDWAYVTEKIKISIKDKIQDTTELPKLIYVGRINKQKGIMDFLKVLALKSTLFESMSIIGHGEKEHELKLFISNASKFKYLGSMQNRSALSKISEADLLILPSIGKDGWGAVINEALMLGVPVLATENCGGSILLDGMNRGEVMSWKKGDVGEIVDKWLHKGQTTSAKRSEISDWTEKCISGVAIKKYFLEIIDHCYSNINDKPVAPWLKS